MSSLIVLSKKVHHGWYAAVEDKPFLSRVRSKV
jgi:hypothetical protein